MDSEKKEKNITEMSVYVKKMAPISITGKIHHSDSMFSVQEINDGYHHFQRKDLAMIILDNINSSSFEGTIQHHKVMTENGGFIAFNGGAIASPIGFPEATAVYITDADDVIVIFEKIVYEYVGDVVVEEKPSTEKREAVKDGQKLP